MIHRRPFTIFSWAMYDFANTIFAMNVISLYFALWVTINMKGEDILYSYALSGSMLLAALSAPILGALSDKLSRRMPFLISFTVICCLLTAALGFAQNLLIGLLLFAGANYCFQVADVFYNSLLPLISHNKNVGRISGLGTSLGYLGTIVGLSLTLPFVLHFGRQAAFLPTALFFFLFALPCFLFVKDKPQTRSRATIITALKKNFATLKNIKHHKNLFLFLCATFIAFNAINTAYIFMSIYIKKLIFFSDEQLIIFYIISSLFAIIGAFIIGLITDKLGAKRTLMGVLMLWCLAFLLVLLAHSQTLFWFIGPLAGISLGGTWTSARALAVALSPAEMIGETFGFYGLMGKTASIVGPLVWGAAISGFSAFGLIKYRIAVAVLLAFLLVSLIILKKVPHKEP